MNCTRVTDREPKAIGEFRWVVRDGVTYFDFVAPGGSRGNGMRCEWRVHRAPPASNPTTWMWNGDEDKPTIEPSLQHAYCHVTIMNGTIVQN